MPADFFHQGPIHVFVKLRWYTWQYLGTALTDPKITANLIYKPIQSERVQPGPYSEMLCTEQHMVAMVLNRIDHRTWNRLRDVGVTFNQAGGQPFLREVPSGTIVTGHSDFELFFRYTLPFAESTPVPAPDGAGKGRLYYSCVLRDYEEDAPNRTQEIGMLVECNPYPIQHKLKLFSEVPENFPNVVPE